MQGPDVGPHADVAFRLLSFYEFVVRDSIVVRLVVSAMHQGLSRAVATILGGTNLEVRRVQCARNALAPILELARLVGFAFGTVFVHPAT